MKVQNIFLSVDIFCIINIVFTILFFSGCSQMTGLDFPDISPILFSIGSFSIRWYSVAYLVGIIAAWALAARNIKKYDSGLTRPQIEDAVFYATIGVILGGRLGYVLFYGGDTFLTNPLQVFAIWQGGMSFHGGAVGAVAGLYYTSLKTKTRFLQWTDLTALYAPIGIFFGRIANFINDELWGRPTDVAWAVKFPSGGFIPRHPSQLYQAFFEGLVIFLVLNWLWRYETVRKNCGVVSSLFVLMYAVFRIILENYRQPDAQLGFFFGFLTMGQLLSIPLVFLGAWVLFKKLKPLK